MSWMQRLFSARRMDRELDTELRHHFDLLVAAKVRAGMTQDDARREARMEFGGHEQVKEDCRESRGTMLAVSALHDLRYALRQAGRNPGFAAVTVLTLALGIGATTAIFSVVNATLLRPLPYKDPARLVMLWSTIPQFGFVGPGAVTDPDFALWERENRVFDGIAAFHQQTSNLTGDGVPERLLGATTTADLFPLLGVGPELGRLFSLEQQVAGKEDVVLLSHQLWARRFASDPRILGKPVRLDGKNFTVLGVMPPSFQFPDKPDFWIPMVLTEERGDATNQVIARLKPGVSLQRAGDDISLLQHRVDAAHRHDEIHLSFVSLEDKLVANIRPALVVLLAAVGLVLLIACANVANLFLTRATARRPEIVMRRTLGASRSRILRQLLTESLLLAGMGGVLGLMLAVATRHLILDIVPQSAAGPVLAKPVSSDIDAWVLAFSVLSSLATGILFGLAPAWNVSRSATRSSARVSGSTQTSEPGTRRIRDFLVVGEFALTLILLVGAGLLLRSFVRLLEVNPGLDPRNLATLNLQLPETKYKTAAPMRNFQNAVLERIGALPGVRSAATVFGMPFGDGGVEGDFTIDGQTQTRPEIASKVVVSPDYFRALGIPLIAGRPFNRDDTPQSEPVAIVSRSFAELMWPGQPAIGKRVGHLFTGVDSCIVAGVVGDVKQEGLTHDAPLAIYLPYSQVPDRLTFLASSITVVIRTEGNPLEVLRAAREAVQSVDPDMPIYDAASMDDLIAKSVSQPRFDSILLATFASLALILAAVGIYGVMSYSVVQRRQEIGIRMALGAGRHYVTRMVVREGAMLACAGIALGIVAALAVSHLIAAFLFGVTSKDPATICGVSALLLVVALLACYLPARRASRVDPMVALRYE